MTTSTTEPTGVAQVLTPSGLEIYYQSGPKRLYRIRHTPRVDVTGYSPNGELEWLPASDEPTDWQEVPSVSTVLGVLDKPALVWWGMKVGVEGLMTLIHDGDVLQPDDEFFLWDQEGDRELATADDVVALLTRNKLTVNHQRDKAADRGTNVHSALEAWAETGITPDPRFYPENERGYVQGLVNFINDAHPHPLQSEVMVASLDGYAGRFDLLANLDFAGKVVTKTYPKREDKREQQSGAFIIDLKTSAKTYPSHALQLAAYRHAMTECGYGEIDHAAVLRVTSDGRYELVEAKAEYSDFLAVLSAYRALQKDLF